MKKLLMILFSMLLIFGMLGLANASIVTIVEQQATNWNYTVIPASTILWSSTDASVWENAGYNSFDWSNATWDIGQAAFSNSLSSALANTRWFNNTNLALQRTYYLDGVLTSLTLNITADNGFILFINGTQVAKENDSGGFSYWEYTQSIDSSVFTQGDNIIEVIAEDHGVSTYFDMELTGNVVPIPEAIWLLGSGLIGIVGIRKKFKK